METGYEQTIEREDLRSLQPEFDLGLTRSEDVGRRGRGGPKILVVSWNGGGFLLNKTICGGG